LDTNLGDQDRKAKNETISAMPNKSEKAVTETFSSDVGKEESETRDATPTSITGLRRRVHLVSWKDIDDTTLFYIKHKDGVEHIKPDDERRLNRKNFWFLLSQTWWVAFLIHLDKSTLAQASTMGIFDDVKMTKNEFNNLFVLFYTGYLIALWPGAALAQRVGHKQFITGSLLLWALLLGMHPLVKTGKQMMGLRFILGMVRTWPISPEFIDTSLLTPTVNNVNRLSRKLFRQLLSSIKHSSPPRRAHAFSCSGGHRAALPMSS
jgi:uncharacterized membrane protein YhaH (DUF805 family)